MWMPPPAVTEHQGDQILQDRHFFIAPPPEIGTLRSAHSSLRQGVAAKSPVVRLAIALAWGAVGFLLAMGLHRFTGILIVPSGITGTPAVLWAVIIGLLPAWIGWRKS